MKYIAIIYGNKELWASFPPEEAARAIAEQDAFNQRFAGSGELLGAYGLGDELTARTVRVTPAARAASRPAASWSTWPTRTGAAGTRS